MDKKELKQIEKKTKEFLDVLGVSAPISIQELEEGVEVNLETEDENGILIGYHGETLEAIQLLLSLVIAKALGKFVRISVEVGQYKKNRMEYLQSIVKEAKEKALTDKTGVSLPNLKSWERRFVHMIVQEDGEIVSESTGVGRDRVLTIYPKS